MRRDLLVLTVLLGLLGAGCPRGGETASTTPEPAQEDLDTAGPAIAPEPEPEPPAEPVATPEPPPPGVPVELRLRALHAAVTATKVGVTLSYAGEGEPAPVAESLGFAASSGYVAASLAPGATEVPLTLAAQGREPASASPAVVAGATHTAIVYATPESEQALSIALVRDVAEAPVDEMRVRFFNAVVGWGEVDVCLPAAADGEAETLLVGVGYGTLADAGYISLPPETRRLEVRAASEDGYCAGRVIGAVLLRPPRGFALSSQNLTLVAVGRTTGRAVPRELVVCQDAPAESPSCFRSAMHSR